MPLLRFELRTSRLLSARSNQLSYRGGGTRRCRGPHKMEAETGRFQHGPATALWGGAGQVRVFAHLCAGLLLGEFVLLLLSLSLSLPFSLSASLAPSLMHIDQQVHPPRRCRRRRVVLGNPPRAKGTCSRCRQSANWTRLPFARRLPVRWGTQTCEVRTMHSCSCWPPAGCPAPLTRGHLAGCGDPRDALGVELREG